MVIYLDIGFNSLRKKENIFSLYFLMVCLQLRLPNNLSTPARLGAGAENAGVGSLGGRYCSSADGEVWETAFVQTRSSDTRHCFAPIPVEVGPPVLSQEGSSPGGTADHSSAIPATRLCSAWLATYLLEQSTGLATASSRKA